LNVLQLQEIYKTIKKILIKKIMKIYKFYFQKQKIIF
jgi:hypothetical protein